MEPDDPAGADRAAEPEAALAGSGGSLAGEEGVARYDPRELRRLVEVSFSAGELSKFAERFGVLLDREGPLDRSARTLVRALEARDELPALVEALRLAKPLVEWPEPSRVAAQAAPPPPSSAPAVPSRRPERPPSPAGRAALVDPFLEEQLGADEEDRWPAWTRWAVLALVLAGGVGVGIVVTFFVTRDDTAAAPGEESPGIASLAAAHLRETVQAVTEACEVPPEDTARDTLTTAFRRCALPPMRPGAVNVPLPTRTPPPSGGAEPPARRQTPAEPRSAACLDECHAGYTGCQKSECGGEPSSINEYDTYQRCMSGCMSKYSRCRLTCR